MSPHLSLYDARMRDWNDAIIPAERVGSLMWQRGELVDLAAGSVRYAMDGSRSERRVNFAFPFDAALTAGAFSVLYTRFGTKALLLKDGRGVRELNRSFYFAHLYEYPVCLVEHDGRTLLIHCPDQYNRLEIEDAETGERLTARTSPAADFFHSRLAVNRDGTRLLSAGWFWHPWDEVVFFDLADALRDPSILDSLEWCVPGSEDVDKAAERASACWLTETKVAIAGKDEPEEPAVEPGHLRPRGVIVYDTTARTILSSVVLDEAAGTIMPIGETHIVAFHRHPRLIRLADGVVEQAWPHLSSGMQTNSFLLGDAPPPPMAFDPEHRRFAIAQPDGIHVVTAPPASSPSSRP